MRAAFTRTKMTQPKLLGRIDAAVSLATQDPLQAVPSQALTAEFDDVRVALIGLPHRRAAKANDRLAIAAELARAYRERGVSCLDDLHGTFALVVIDRRRNEALLAIDRIGVEALCYATTDRGLVFGTDAGAVARSASGDHAAALDPQALFNYLYYHCIPAPLTAFSGVGRLLAGHRIVVRDGKVDVAPYWQPSYAVRTEPLETRERTFLDLAQQSVATAIDGARSPGAFLSGGTDSSTVAGLMRAALGAAPKTYSIGFDAQGFDEMAYARLASKHFGTEHHEYYITPSDLVASIPRLAAASDQPFGNSSLLPTYYCARMAEADGIDRMLGGDGGDELFGGNTRYAKQHVFDYYDRSPGIVRGALQTVLAPALWESVPFVRKARSYVHQARVPMPDRMHTYNLLTRIGSGVIFESAFLAAVDAAAPMEDMRAWYERAESDSLVNRMLAFDLKYTLTDNDLPKVRIGCFAAGVEPAFPFLDDRIVDFAASLQPHLKLKGLQLRWFFKHALRNFLPTEIINKSKHGFGLPFGIWLRRDAALNALAFESLEGLKLRGIVRADFIDLLRAELVSDHATFYGEFVWILMMLEQWLRVHAPGAALSTVVRR